MAKPAKSIVGEVYGNFTVLHEYAVKKDTGRVVRYVDCLCACGRTHTTAKGSLRNGTSTSCGCAKEVCTTMSIGDTVNHLTLVGKPYKKEGQNYYRAIFRCDCGNTKEVAVQNVKAGTTLSCGCIKARNKAKVGSVSTAIPDKNDIAKVCDMYRAGSSSYSISEQYGVSQDTVLRILRTNNVPVRAKEDQHIRGESHIDRTKFSDTSCRESAYYYGILLADGCMTGNQVSLSLKNHDGYMVERLHKWLNAQTTVYTRSREDSRTGKVSVSVNMHFADRVITSTLRSLGMTERKSTVEVVPSCFIMNPDFWRGMMDGDGHISSNSNQVSLCGSLAVCEGFVNYCKSLGVTPAQAIKKVGKIHVINLTGFDGCKRVLDELYKDTDLFLLRKYNSYRKRYYKEDHINATD